MITCLKIASFVSHFGEPRYCTTCCYRLHPRLESELEFAVIGISRASSDFFITEEEEETQRKQRAVAGNANPSPRPPPQSIGEGVTLDAELGC